MLNQEDQGSIASGAPLLGISKAPFLGSSDSVGVDNVIVEFWWGVKVDLEGVFGKKCVLIYIHTYYIYIKFAST